VKRNGTSRILTPAQYDELLETVSERDQRCWFADSIPHQCLGEGEAAHLIEQSKLKRHYPFGMIKKTATVHGEDGSKTTRELWLPASRVEMPGAAPRIDLDKLAMDDRNVVYACSWIHRIFDARVFRHKPLEFPRSLLDPRFEMFVNEFNLERLAAARFPVHMPDDFDNPLGIEIPEEIYP
jgi:hypothetical protein